MGLPSALQKKIYVAYLLGANKDNKLEYTEPIQIFAQVSDAKSIVMREDVGSIPNYDRIVIVPQGENSQYIDENTLLWLSVEPNSTESNMDFKIERVGDIIDGNVILYCSSLSANRKPLYYEYKGKIFQTRVDMENLVAIVPDNKYLPINGKTSVWLTKPEGISSVKNKIELVSIEHAGNSRKFNFRRV